MTHPDTDAPSHSRAWLAPASVLALGLAAFATSLGNGFAFDDKGILVRNDRVHHFEGLRYFAQSYWPTALYRPATIMGFALQWQIAGGASWVFHLVNLLLYLALVLAVLRLARRLLTPGAAWLVAALFAVHPVHVEAVANVVGQPEILVPLLQVTAVIWYLSRRETIRSAGTVLGIASLYLLSCLAKESGIMLPGLLLAAEATVVPARGNWRDRARAVAPLFGLLGAIAVTYLVVRTHILGQFAGDLPHPWLEGLGLGGRVLTMLAVVPQWFRLLVVPWHLQADYMPKELDRATGVGDAQVLGAVLVLGWASAAWRLRKVCPTTTFGLLWIAVSLFPVSNVLVPTGILLAERTLVSPTVGAMLALGGLAPLLAEPLRAAPSWERRVAGGFMAAVLLLGVWRSAARSLIWRNDSTLFRQTVLDAPRSYKAHAALGQTLFDEGRRQEGERELRLALEIYPYDTNVFAALGEEYQKAGLCAPAIPLFRDAVRLAPEASLARNKLIHCLAETGDSAAAEAEVDQKFRRGEPDAAWIRGAVDSVLRARAASVTTR